MDNNKKLFNCLTFQEKFNAIEMMDSGQSVENVAKEFKVGKTTLYYCKKNRDKIEEICKEKTSSNMKRIAQSKNPKIDAAILCFIKKAQQRGQKITRNDIKSVALETAAELNVNSFVASTGWLTNFIKRNGIILNKSSNQGTSNYYDDNESEEDNLQQSNEGYSYWKHWCRLCGNVEAFEETDCEILETVHKLFELERKDCIYVCKSCSSSIQSIFEITKKSSYLKNMFVELEELDRTNFLTNEDVINIRTRYDISMNGEDDLAPFREIQFKVEKPDDSENEKIANEDYSIQNEFVANNYELTDEIIQKVLTSKLKAKKSLDEEKPIESSYIYQCHICHENFERMCFLTNHTRELHNCLPQVACTCGKILGTWDSLMAHKRMHSKDPRDWICDLCGLSFTSKSGLKIHIKHKHRKPNRDKKSANLCTQCGRNFRDGTTLRNHEKTHLPDEERLIYECDICFKKLSTKSSLVAHKENVHVEEKSILCHLCSKAFPSKRYLKTHLLTHEVENVRCEICDGMFKNKMSLQSHKNKVHKPRELFNFVCSICDKRFRNRQLLEHHSVTHTDERNFKCTIAGCDMSYKRKKDLVHHIARHYGDRKHKCLWCETSCIDSANLRKHKLRYHPNEVAEFEAKYGKGRRMREYLLRNEDIIGNAII